MSNLSDLNGTYALDPAHSTISFVARHAVITKVRGSFDDFSGKLVIDGADLPDSTAAVELQVASVDTRSADRDNHLKSADFFDAEKFPTIDFASTSVKADGDDAVEVTGDLTIKGQKHEITIPLDYTGTAVDPFGNTRVGFEGAVTVNRKDFGLTWNAALETGGVLVSEKVTLEFDISAIKQAA